MQTSDTTLGATAGRTCSSGRSRSSTPCSRGSPPAFLRDWSTLSPLPRMEGDPRRRQRPPATQERVAEVAVRAGDAPAHPRPAPARAPALLPPAHGRAHLDQGGAPRRLGVRRTAVATRHGRNGDDLDALALSSNDLHLREAQALNRLRNFAKAASPTDSC
jgi:hypothetical protein